MKYHLDNKRNSKRGIIYVASCDKLYYELALLSCESLKDIHPDSDVTLYTHEKFIDDRCKMFDKVIYEIPNHVRAKMWCMARTPYDETLYNDTDTMICHKDIRNIHNHLNKCDMFFGSQLNYTVANQRWEFIDKRRTIPVKLHGSMCGYRKTDLILDFMQTWFDEYDLQRKSNWQYDFAYQEWKQFDMFTLWRMTSGRYNEFERFNNLKINILSRRWNTTIQDLPEDLDGPRVITQIDKNSYERMPYAWSQISKRIMNERFIDKQCKIN